MVAFQDLETQRDRSKSLGGRRVRISRSSSGRRFDNDMFDLVLKDIEAYSRV